VRQTGAPYFEFGVSERTCAERHRLEVTEHLIEPAVGSRFATMRSARPEEKERLEVDLSLRRD
jgi:hypothetical protein